MKKIEDFINHLECPMVNGIIFPDGTMQLFDIEVDWGSPLSYRIKAASKSSISILNSKGDLRWNDCAILANIKDRKHAIEIIAGEGDYGSDGFIGVIDLNSRKLKWLGFFDCSNPFDKIKIIDVYVYVYSTNNCVWKFKLKDPLDFVVECY